MRGYESIVLTDADDVPFIEVCGECSRVENSFDQGDDGYPDDHDDHDDEQEGTELSMKSSAWPCATYTAVAGSGSRPAPQAEVLSAIRGVLDRWENGALINNGDGIVWREPVRPLPPGTDEIRKALAMGGA
jgi:hypothetical protein